MFFSLPFSLLVSLYYPSFISDTPYSLISMWEKGGSEQLFVPAVFLFSFFPFLFLYHGSAFSDEKALIETRIYFYRLLYSPCLIICLEYDVRCL